VTGQAESETSVVLYGKSDCHLCDDAAAILGRVGPELGFTWIKVDIEQDPSLYAQYRYRIPVIEVRGGLTLDWPTTAERVRRAVLSAR
jgi:glutaredoxin